MTKIIALASAGAFLFGGLVRAADTAYTPIHEAGRCAFRDHCGSKSFFGKQLPCVDNGKAKEPDQELRDQLVQLCGPKWKDGPVCCTSNQVCSSPSIADSPSVLRVDTGGHVDH